MRFRDRWSRRAAICRDSRLKLPSEACFFYDNNCVRSRGPCSVRNTVARLDLGIREKVRSLVRQEPGLDEISVDDLATTAKLQSWEAVQISERLKFSSKLAIK